MRCMNILMNALLLLNLARLTWHTSLQLLWVIIKEEEDEGCLHSQGIEKIWVRDWIKDANNNSMGLVG